MFNTHLFSGVSLKKKKYVVNPLHNAAVFKGGVPRRRRLQDLSSLRLISPLSFWAPGAGRRYGYILRILPESNPLVASTEIGPAE